MLELCRAEQVLVKPDPATSSSRPQETQASGCHFTCLSLYLSSVSPAGSDSIGKLSSLQASVGQCPSLRPASSEPYK